MKKANLKVEAISNFVNFEIIRVDIDNINAIKFIIDNLVRNISQNI